MSTFKSTFFTAIFFTISIAPIAYARGVLPITQEQDAKIQTALQTQTNASNKAMGQAIAEASSTISSFLRINSCLSDYNASALNAYAAPGKIYPNNNYISGPVTMMPRHDKNTCATVIRIHGWSMPTDNALKFEVVYMSDSSGESVKTAHELRKQPSGEWLFAR